MLRSLQRNLAVAGEALPALHHASDASDAIQSVLGSSLALCQLCVSQRRYSGASFFVVFDSTELIAGGSGSV